MAWLSLQGHCGLSPFCPQRLDLIKNIAFVIKAIETPVSVVSVVISTTALRPEMFRKSSLQP